MKKEQKHTEWLPYHFAPDEKTTIAQNLAQANQSRSELEDKKAQVMAEFKSQITATEAVIAKEARRYNNGYEYRDIECGITMDSPRRGRKTIHRIDTGEFVKEVDMTAEDMQQKLSLDEAE